MGHCLFMRKGETHTAPISGILASDLAVGSSVYLMENGVATEYLVVNQGKPSGSSLYDDSCDGTWLLRKELHSSRVWDADGSNVLETSDIHIWLNGDFFNLFGAVEQAAIKQVKIPYRSGGGSGGTDQSGANGLSAKVFLLSGYEIGWTNSMVSYLPVDGAKLDYFDEGTDTSADNKRIAYLSGSAYTCWLRSPTNSNKSAACFVRPTGGYSNSGSTGNCGIRPSIILPSNSLFDKTTMLLKGVA